LFIGDLSGSTADYSNDAFGQIDGDGIDNAEVDENKEDEDQCRMDYELEMSWEHHRAKGSPSGFGMEIDLDDKGNDKDYTTPSIPPLASLQNSALTNLYLTLFAIHLNILIHELAQWHPRGKLQTTDIQMLLDRIEILGHHLPQR